MIELLSVLIAFVVGFVCGLTYALRLYKRMEADCDREWAKRHGMREVRPRHGESPQRLNPILRRQRL